MSNFHYQPTYTNASAKKAQEYRKQFVSNHVKPKSRETDGINVFQQKHGEKKK